MVYIYFAKSPVAVFASPTFNMVFENRKCACLIYINDLRENLSCSVTLFTDDTSLFTIVQDPNSAASDLNHDLDLIRLWAHK